MIDRILCFAGVHRFDLPRLIFSGGRNTHYEVKQCRKCCESKTVFSGTRDEWYEYHGFNVRGQEKV